MERKFITINSLAKKFGLSKSKLNYYVNLGIIEPLEVLSSRSNGIKIFDAKEATKRVNFIIRHRARGYSLKEIKGKIEKEQNK